MTIYSTEAPSFPKPRPPQVPPPNHQEFPNLELRTRPVQQWEQNAGRGSVITGHTALTKILQRFGRLLACHWGHRDVTSVYRNQIK